MKLRLTELKYVGHIISKDGIKPDPKKVNNFEHAIANKCSPTETVHGYG